MSVRSKRKEVFPGVTMSDLKVIDRDKWEELNQIEQARKKPVTEPTETDIQKQCVKYIEMQYPKWMVHHSPNEGSLTYGHKSWFALMAKGTKRGYPDLDILAPNGRTLRIEMKRPKGVLSDHQRKMLIRMNELGHTVYVCKSFDEFKWLVDSWAKGETIEQPLF